MTTKTKRAARKLDAERKANGLPPMALMADGRALQAKRFELWDMDDGLLQDRDVDLGAFARDNDLEPEELNAIGALDVGQSVDFGGGAAPWLALRRVR